MPNFLSLEEVLLIHSNQVDLYGGEPNVRDLNILESAIAQPRATYGGNLLHGDLFEMAAAYLYHIAQNHPFHDGNKRAGAAMAIVFLAMNDIALEADEEGLVNITLAVAQGQAGKSEVAAFFRKIAK